MFGFSLLKKVIAEGQILGYALFAFFQVATHTTTTPTGRFFLFASAGMEKANGNPRVEGPKMWRDDDVVALS